MSNEKIARFSVFLILGLVVLAYVVIGPGVLEAVSKTEYKFVRLVDDGAMPVITQALNVEAERGWELEEMAVIPGEPGTIYLVFKK